MPGFHRDGPAFPGLIPRSIVGDPQMWCGPASVAIRVCSVFLPILCVCLHPCRCLFGQCGAGALCLADAVIVRGGRVKSSGDRAKALPSGRVIRQLKRRFARRRIGFYVIPLPKRRGVYVFRGRRKKGTIGKCLVLNLVVLSIHSTIPSPNEIGSSGSQVVDIPKLFRKLTASWKVGPPESCQPPEIPKKPTKYTRTGA